jgi:hypothetical protein
MAPRMKRYIVFATAAILWSPTSHAQSTARPATGPSVPPAIAQMNGPWELIGQGGSRKCRLNLRPAETKGGRVVGYPSPCRRALPILAKVASWSVSEDGFIRLNNAAGQPVLAFEDDPAALRLKGRADGADYQLDSLGRPRRFVPQVASPPPQRMPFDPSRAPQRDTIPGSYEMVRYGGQVVCRIALGLSPGSADGRFLTSFPTRCRDKGLEVFDVVAWRYAGGKIYLIARRGHEMTLIPVNDGQWQKDPPGGAELTLRRVAN